jgi:RHS repeat-associated protein
MGVRVALIKSLLLATVAGPLFAQSIPALSNIESPYPPIQGSVQLGGTVYGSGAVAYGPVNTPLVLSGKDFGAEGTVNFTPIYNNGNLTYGTPVPATVSMWNSSILFLAVPAGAVSGLVTVTSGGRTSNPLPFVVTNGVYTTGSASGAMCPAFPPNNELEVTTSSLPNGVVGQAYSATLNASGGTPPYTWTLAAGSLPSGLSLSASTGLISGMPTTGANPINITVKATDSRSLTADAVLRVAIDSSTLLSGVIYSYTVPTGDYDHAGNVHGYSDFIMGTWSMQYDHLNRLSSASASGSILLSPYSGQNLCFDYDSFGNRTQADLQTTACNPNPTPSVAPSSYDPSTASYNAANHISWLQNLAPNGLSYDGSGNVTYDGINYYSYDAEGRICAAETWPYSGGAVAYGYLYDAEGRRVAKGKVNPTPYGQAPSCDPSSNGFTLTESYVLGQGGERLTTSSWAGGTGTWENTNVYAEGKLIATYDSTPSSASAGQPTVALHFNLNDPLGTRRMQTNAAGQPELDCQSLPFGDQLYCFPDPNAPGDDPSEDATGSLTGIHFTGKERDQESGLDYFGARYYGSNMGRWMSPDPINLTNARLMNPSNTLNKYAYAANNPLKYIDRDGQDITIYYRPPTGGATDFGHVLIGALNQDTGKTAFLDFYPGTGGTNAIGAGAGAFNLGDMSERGATNAAGGFASLTIQTNPEQAQKIIDFIERLKNGPAPDYSAFLGNNCTTMCEDALHDLGLDFGAQSPSSFWQHAWANFSDAALNNTFKAFLSAPQATGHDYGRPQFPNQSQLMFQLYFNQMHPEQDHTSVTTTQGDGMPCGGSTGNPCK